MILWVACLIGHKYVEFIQEKVARILAWVKEKAKGYNIMLLKKHRRDSHHLNISLSSNMESVDAEY